MIHALAELPLAGCIRFLLPAYTGLLIRLALAHFRQDSLLSAGVLKPPKGAIEGFVLSYAYLCHEYSPPFDGKPQSDYERSNGTLSQGTRRSTSTGRPGKLSASQDM